MASAQDKAMEIDPVIILGTRLSEIVSHVGWLEAMKNPLVSELVHRIELELTEKP